MSLKIKNVEVDGELYPMMMQFAKPIRDFKGTLVRKEDAIEALFATFADPVVSNAVLLAPPGTGKTTLMRGLAYQDKKRVYLEAELSEMITGLRDNAEMGQVVKNLFEEIGRFGKEHHMELVIFVDEFHQLIDFSPVVAEAFKPILADSAAMGLRLVVATTYEEFRRNIMPNQALTERLQRVSLPQPREEDVMIALESLAKQEKLNVMQLKPLFKKIYEVTEQFMPSANQPRKSVLTLSRMIGYSKAHRMKIDEKLLAYVLRTSQNIEIDFKADIDRMEAYIREHVFSQDGAIDALMDSIVISIMGLNDNSKPRGSFILSGPTGTGKALVDDTFIYKDVKGERVLVRHGDLQVGDYVYDVNGNPTKVLGVYPQGKCAVYRLTFADNRMVYANAEHLWSVSRETKRITLTTKQLMEDGFDDVMVPTTQGEIGIKEIRPFGNAKKSMTCIYVEHEEHLYQLANGIITHNTELVKRAGSQLFPDPNAFIRFDMTEYAQANSIDRFRKLVTTRAWEYPFSLFLFDEIEKAHETVVRLLMQLLDDGRLTDENNRVVNFTNCYVFLTTNLGTEIYDLIAQYESNDTGGKEGHSRSFQANVRKSLIETSGGGFPPELVNRVDAIVPFQPLSENTLIAILRRNIRKLLVQIWETKKIATQVDEDVITYLGHDVMGDQTDQGGGRQVLHVVNEQLAAPISRFIYYNPKVKQIYLWIEGTMRYGNKRVIDSDAHIVISATPRYSDV